MSAGKSDLVDIDGLLVHETELAYLFDYGGAEPIWLSKSQCEYDADMYIMTMSARLALEKGLI